MVTAPLFAAGPETALAGVWSRTAEHAQALAARHHVPAFESYDALLDACDAVAIVVSPGAQPEFAIRAARAGKAVLLEKPLAFDVENARTGRRRDRGGGRRFAGRPPHAVRPTDP